MAYVLVLLVVGGLIAALYFLRQARSEQDSKQWTATRKNILLKILVPKNNEKTPAAAEHLLASLHGIFRPDARFQEFLSFEIAARSKSIEFYVYCPVDFRDFVEGQIYAQYPTVEVQEVADYTRVDLTTLRVAAVDLELNKSDVYPIKTFPNFEVDPLAGITGVLSQIGDQEQIWVQTVIQPVSDVWQKRSLSYISAVRSGTLRKDNAFLSFIRGIFNFFQSAPDKPKQPPKLSSSNEQALKSAEEKSTKLGFTTKMRIVVLAPDAATANMRINAITGAYKQFNTINMNGFVAGKLSTEPSAVDIYHSRNFEGVGNIMNIEELASIYHFPNATVETPNIVWAGAKKGQPPPNLPVEGTVDANDVTYFGYTDFRIGKQKFGIKLADRRLHMYMLGKSGTGKSTMLENMAIDDIRKGRGVAIVDPHGDTVNTVLKFIPANRVNDVVYFNPADRDYPIGFNLLENIDPELKNIVASGLMSIFTKLWANVWSARMEYILRNTILALLEYPNATMLSVMRLLNDDKFRQKVIAKVTDPVIKDFFINEFEKYDPKFRTEAIAPIQNKVGQFLSSTTIRNIVGQPQSTFNIEEAMNSKKILLFDLSIGKIGEDAAALLGAMMITKIQLAAMRRSNIENKNERVDFYLYIDEFQNFATESFEVILSEARKYHLNLILTHQYIGQLPENVAKAIFGNVGTLVSFRVGASDAVALVKEFEPVFEANDLINLDNHHIYAKMSIDGVTRPAFSALTLPPADDANNNKEKIIRVSRERYSQPRDFVEKKVLEVTWAELSRPTNEIVSEDRQDRVGDEANESGSDIETTPLETATAPKPEKHKAKDGTMWYFVEPDGLEEKNSQEGTEQILVEQPTDKPDTPEPISEPVQPESVQPPEELSHADDQPSIVVSQSGEQGSASQSAPPVKSQPTQPSSKPDQQSAKPAVKAAENLPKTPEIPMAKQQPKLGGQSPKSKQEKQVRREPNKPSPRVEKVSHSAPARTPDEDKVLDTPREPDAQPTKSVGKSSQPADVQPLKPNEVIVFRD